MYCSKCGASLTPDVAFCGSCGAPVGRAVAPAPALPLPPAYPAVPARTPYADPAGLAVSKNFVYAGFWLRFVACLIDRVIIGFAILLLFVPLLFLTGLTANLHSFAYRHGQADPAILGGLIAVFLLFVMIAVFLQWLYYAYFESEEKQAT